MQAQINFNRIIITIDQTDKPLFEALLHAGVPREQMIFAYLNNTRPLTYNPPEGACAVVSSGYILPAEQRSN